MRHVFGPVRLRAEVPDRRVIEDLGETGGEGGGTAAEGGGGNGGDCKTK